VRLVAYELDRLRARREQACGRYRRRRTLVAGGMLIAVIAAGPTLAGVGSDRRRRAHRPPTGERGRVDAASSSQGTARPVAGTTTAGALGQTPAEHAATARLARYGLPVYCGARRDNLVALSFDDGPGTYTYLAFRKLRQFHGRATFFLVARNRERRPLSPLSLGGIRAPSRLEPRPALLRPAGHAVHYAEMAPSSA
jgi:hypothetical protein